jgi:hypothetical protein
LSIVACQKSTAVSQSTPGIDRDPVKKSLVGLRILYMAFPI